MPMDIHENVTADGDTDDEFDQREQGSPVHQHPPHHSPHIPASSAHTTHFSDHFAGTSLDLRTPHLMIYSKRCVLKMPLTLKETT